MSKHYSPGAPALRAAVSGSRHTLQSVAELLGVSHSAVAQWARGACRPNRARAAQLEVLLDIPQTAWTTTDELQGAVPLRDKR